MMVKVIQLKQALAEDFGVAGRVDYVGTPGFILGASAYLGETAQGQQLAGEEVARAWLRADDERDAAECLRLGLADAVTDFLARDRLVLGICNGCQVLVEAGLVPGLEPGAVEVALAANRFPGRRSGSCPLWTSGSAMDCRRKRWAEFSWRWLMRTMKPWSANSRVPVR